MMLFQSAPLTKARGDLRWAPAVSTVDRFNPLPSQKQGETRLNDHPRLLLFVSIRSPHKSKGRHDGLERGGHEAKFQSAPLTKARGDGIELTGQSVDIRVSIRSPHKSKGRHTTADRADIITPVSIRSPHKSKGRLFGPWLPYLVWCCFNPLPSQKQGETYPACDLRGVLSVSIRSPHKSKGRPMAAAAPTVPAEFQSAPLTKARGDFHLSIPPPQPIRVSIRSPHKSKGRQSALRGASGCFEVSIRSPHKSKGRRPAVADSSRRLLFQSAPLTKARGDP